MGVPIVQVDVFTDRPFRGNPAAVCVLDVPAADPWMQDVALEMYQASSRGGVMRVRLDGDRVALGGQAITVLRGELAV